MNRGLPVLIQGGMGVAVSDWRLARAVSQAGHLGVVSGTALDTVVARRLQVGDIGGHVRRALAAFPIPTVAEKILDRYYVAGGKKPGKRFKSISMKRDKPSRNLEDLVVASNFVEVYLAREGHHGVVGINYLEKLQAPTLPSLYGAIIAGVDYVLMGAGIPRGIPAILNRLAKGLPVELKLNATGAERDDYFHTKFDPVTAMKGHVPRVKRPKFLAIVSSHVLAVMLARKIEVPVDGFVVEAPSAGGHNAPPRGKLQLSDSGEPIYGERDVPDLSVIRELGLPFWLAGGYSKPERVHEALELGATGVQVGTPFAYCEESGFDSDMKRRVLAMSHQKKAKVFTDPLASPSGFPFKILQVGGTLSNSDVYQDRTRICDSGYLRTAYRTDEGKMAWRCPSEPVDIYVSKGGTAEETLGRMCLCNALLAAVGLGQIQHNGDPEPVVITSGDGVTDVARFLPPNADSYKAADVIRYLLPDG